MDSPLLSLPTEERERIEALARRRGFDASESYVKALIEADAVQHGEIPPLKDDGQVDIRAEFKQAWREVMEGKAIPIEDVWKALDDE
jgi:hypothetical protein